MDLERVYLEHILLFLRSNDPDGSVLTTLINSWYAHYRGPPFVDEVGKPRWLSSVASKKLLAPHVHAVSKAAKLALANGQIRNLVIDHTIPSAELIRSLRRRERVAPFADALELRNYLAARFTLALLTKREHDVILRSVKSTMPKSWCDDEVKGGVVGRFSRYEAVNRAIEFELQVIC